MAIAKEHHVSRYCRPAVFKNGSVQDGAFLARDDDPEPSCNWIEYFKDKSRQEAVAEIRACFIAKPFQLSKKGAFAILSVRQALEALRAWPEILFSHEPTESPKDDSHSVIKSIPQDPDSRRAISALLSDQVFETYPGLPEPS